MKETFLSCVSFVFEDFSNEERIGQDLEHVPYVRNTARERERDKESECGSELTILHDCERNVSRCKCLTLSSGFLLMQEFQ